MLAQYDILIVGGGMAYTFIKAKGGRTGNSLVEEDKLELAKKLLAQAKEKGVNIYLPKDSILANDFNAKAKRETKASNKINKDFLM